jgi:hypothetical protein
LRQDSIFRAVHGCESGVCSIVVPAQVQHPVKRVQEQLPFHRDPVRLRLPPSFRHANHDVAGGYAAAPVLLQRKRQYVGGAREAHEPLVKARHPPVADEGDRQLAQVRAKDGVGGPQVPADERHVTLRDVRGDGQ